jgi:lysophospholipase L1-like esterase
MQDGVETMAEVTMIGFSNAGYINADGELITPSSFYATDFLSVVGGSKLTCKLSAAANIAYVAFYTDNSEEDFLSVSNANTGQVIEIQVPSTANYFRASTNFNTSSESYISDAFVKYLTLGYGSKRLKDIEDEIAALTPGESKIITTKKWVAIGDSITWLDGHKQGVAERPEHGYQHYLQQRIQFSECFNNGESGATMLDYNYDHITTQGDIYTIMLGINDWSDTKLTPVGTLTDYKNYVTTTGSGEYATVTNFAEALARLIIKIKRVSTNAFVILITPKRSNSYTSQTAHFPASSMVANAGGIYLHQYADIIKEVADYEGYPCVDLYHNGGFTDQNMPALCYDNLHPNDIGMELIASDLYPAMEKICRAYVVD